MPLTQNISGPSGQMYAEQKITPDETKFTRDHTSAAYSNSPYFVAHKNQVQAIPPPRKDVKNVQQPVLLSDFLPKSVLTGITTTKKISFHADVIKG
jgi:hypothetical protein